MKRLCTICARGGSKGVPGKNVRLIAGKPLIAHSIAQARATGLFELVSVSSDSAEILEVSKAWGADLVIERPADMASDTAAKAPAIRHAMLETERRTGTQFDLLVDLDATSPLRIPDDIKACVDMLERLGHGNVVTAALARRSPYFNMLEVDADGIARLSKPLPKNLVRRQDAPACYDMNASIYAWWREPFVSAPYVLDDDTHLYVMPPERSHDIDEALDFVFVEFLLKQRETAP